MARVRNTYMKDYGISSEENRRLIEFCRNATAEEKNMILEITRDVYPSISYQLYENLTTGIGYDRLSKREPIRIPRNDFQGYRRKCLKMIYDFISKRGKVYDQ